jgi:hypothetical protein
LIGAELRDHRNRARQTATAAAALLNCAASKISHMESGRYRQAPAEISALLEFYGADPSVIDHLVSLAARDDGTTWWAPWHDVVPDWLQTFIGLEALADEEFTYEQVMIPGLLQTADYAAAMTAASRRVRPDSAGRLVEFRLARQRRLVTADGLHVTAIIEESALHRPVGSSDVMHGQLTHLVEISNLPNVTLHVLPLDLGVHSGMTGRFTILSFRNVRSIAFVEHRDGGVYVQDQQEVHGYVGTAESLRGDALGHNDSVSLITSLIKELN